MTKNILLEGDITAADTFTPLTTRGSETSPSLQIPAGWSKLTRMIVACAVDMAAAGSAIIILRLTGPAINGTHDIVIAGMGGQAVQAGSDAPPMAGDNQEFNDLDIDVNGGDVITVQACQTDTDLGTVRVVVALYGE